MILLLEELKEPRRATPTVIYNDMTSPRKHRLTLQVKKTGQTQGLSVYSLICNPLNHPRTARLLFPFDRWKKLRHRDLKGMQLSSD